MHVSRLRTRHPLGAVFVEAAEERGFAANADYNGERQDGAAEPQVTQHRGWRWSAARAYLGTAKHRRNLEIRTGFAVQQLTFEGTRCSGVVARADDGSTHRFELSTGGEVVLSSGSLGSPKLLMLSGIGPGDALQAH
jgi:choline dehydrogenase